MPLSQTELEAHLKSINERLNKIEERLNIASSPGLSESPPAEKGPQVFAEPSLNSPVKAGTVLGIIAVICFVLAAGFIIKLSIESGWLTPERQIGLAALLGFSLIAGGFVLWRNDKEYASFLPAAGVIVLFCTVFAAHQYYDLISFHLALGMTTAVSVICILLYLKSKYPIYALMSAIGAYTTPILFDLNEAAFFTLYYFIFCSVAFSIISLWIESRLLILVSSYLAIIFSAKIGIKLGEEIMVIYLLASNLVIFLIANFLYSLRVAPMTRAEAWRFFPILILFYFTEYELIARLNEQFAPWIALAFAAVILVLYEVVKIRSKNQELESQSMIFALVSLICLHVIYFKLFSLETRPWILVFIMVSFALLPERIFAKKSKSDFLIPILVIFFVIVSQYLNLVAHLIKKYEAIWLLMSTAAFASIWLVELSKKVIFSKRTDLEYFVLGAAHLLGILVLYRFTDPYGSLAVTASWLFCAICVMWYAFQKKDKVMANSALIILAFATGKAFLYDVASAKTGIRILCLLLTGLVLYGAGFLMRKISSWKK